MYPHDNTRWTISQIKYAHEHPSDGHATEAHFFDRSTMRFFGNRMSDFRVRHIDQKIYVINTMGGAVYLFDPESGELDNVSDDQIPYQISRVDLMDMQNRRLQRFSSRY